MKTLKHFNSYKMIDSNVQKLQFFLLRSNRQRKKNVRKQTVKFDVVNPIYGLYYFSDGQQVDDTTYMSQLLLLGKFEYGGGPIFKVVLEC